MDKQIFTLHETTRKNLLTYLEKYSVEELAKIPSGFNNSIFWNIAHCIVTQQILCYKLSSTPLLISEDFLDKYKKGTFPTKKITSEEVENIKKLLISTQKQLETDYFSQKFGHFSPYETSYGFLLASIEDAISFNNSHEAMHLGTIKALSYFV